MPAKLSEMRGAKYPDEAVMRFFFKEGLHKTPGRVVEFGCGSGNNLALLFLQYGYDVIGVDRDSEVVQAARHNCKLAAEGCDGVGEARIIQADMELGVPFRERCDVILFPGIIYYLSREKLLTFLGDVNDRVAKPGSWVFVRARGMSDYRFARGRRVEKHGTILDTPETGEEGLRNVCYHEYELVDMFRGAFSLGADSLRVMHIHFENRMMFRSPDGDQMLNHDIVLYGRVRSL